MAAEEETDSANVLTETEDSETESVSSGGDDGFKFNFQPSSRQKKIFAGIAILMLIVFGGVYYFKNNAKSDIDPVVASVNSEEIFLSQLDRAYTNINLNANIPLTKEEVLGSLIDQLLVLQALKASGTKVSDAEVADYIIKTLQERGLPEDVFYRRAADNGLAKSEVFYIFKDKLLMKNFYEAKINPQINISDEIIVEFYDQNQESFFIPDIVNVSHILVESEEKANDIKQQLENGVPLEGLTGQSIDPSAGLNKGNLGFIAKGQTVPEFENAAFSLAEGEISKPVKTQYGYHIIEVSQRESARYLPYDKVKDVIYQILFSRRQKELFDFYVDILRGKSKIEMYSSVLNKEEKQ